MSSSKITDRHRLRRAVVYVRQSTPGQVAHRTESAVRQYALADRAVDLGWPAESVLVVDEDTGQSAAWSHSRIGFKELVAEVGLGHVGAIFALEVSRLARSSSDWHQLLDLCAMTGTLIADADGVYAPGDFNDRLLLGLKGTMSEAELHLIHSRLRGGIESKARRGELKVALPIGLDRDETGAIGLTADEQVRVAIEHVYATWRRCGSARQVVAELAGEQHLLPRRTVGQQRIRWEPASFGAVHDLLTNPVYAGAFVWGRTRYEKTVGPGGEVKTRCVTVAMEDWEVCITDHHPGYVSWEEYLATRARLTANARARGQGGGAAREGAALLQGLARCGKCGRKMMVAYSGKNGRAVSYKCSRTHETQGSRRPCQALGGVRLDAAVGEAFLAAATPAAVQATADAIGQLHADHDQRVAQQQLAVERADYEADRARRQFDACEPENRLVARTLERGLEAALGEAERARRRLAEIERQRPAALSAQELRALKRVAADLRRIWSAPTTTDRDRKQLIRTLVCDAVLVVDRDSARAEVELFWQGGAQTRLSVGLNRQPVKRNDTPVDVVELIGRLAEHSNDAEIAMVLSRQGRRTATGLTFTASRVAGIRERAGIPAARAASGEGVSIRAAATELGVSTQTIRRWVNDGLLPAVQTAPHAPWRIRLSDEVRAKFKPDVPDGYLPLQQAAQRLGVSRQTVLNQVRAGTRDAVQVVDGRRRGLRINVQDGDTLC